MKVIGGGQTSLEALLIKRRIKGPCWLRLAQPERITDSSRQVWRNALHRLCFSGVRVDTRGIRQ